MRPTKVHKHEIEREVRNLLNDGVYDPHELFNIVSNKYVFADYRMVRQVIHEVKSYVG